MRPVLAKDDFSVWRLRRVVSGYRRCVARLHRMKVGRDHSFRIYDKTGKFLGNSSPEIVMPVSMHDALRVAPFLLQLEDKRFYQHSGVDFYSVARAAARNIQRGSIVQGGSTLSMQLVRNTLIEPKKSFLRKTVEMGLAMKMESHFSKNEILRLYCEQVFMGNQLRGFQSAAFFVFRKPLFKLSDEEICGLLGMLRSPERTGPYRSVAAYSKRRSFICRTLKKNDCAARPINPIRVSTQARPRIARAIRRAVNAADTETCPRRVGVTLDACLQKKADALLSRASKHHSISAMSFVAIDNKTGGLLAESSWSKGTEMDFSPILDGKIQPGSTFKLFALIAAVEQGYDIDKFTLLSAPYCSPQLRDRGGRPWSVENYGNVYRGEISLRRAFVVSDNCVFARLAEILDLPHLFSVYRRFGLLDDSENSYPSIVLGSTKQGVSAVKLALAYQSIANNGVIFPDAKLVGYVESYNGALSRHILPRPGYMAHVINSENLPSIHGALYAAARSYGINYLGGKTGTTSGWRVLTAFNKKASVLLCATKEKGAGLAHATRKYIQLFPDTINKLAL